MKTSHENVKLLGRMREVFADIRGWKAHLVGKVKGQIGIRPKDGGQMRSLLEDEPKPDEIEIPPEGISLDLLREVYRNSSLALSVRMRAAIAALPHEVPKLAVTYQATENDFASLLDRRLKRIEEMRLIEAQPTNGEKVDVRLAPTIPDRRFRRV